MKYIAFDIEIVKEISEGDDWMELRPLGISCAATIRSDDYMPRTFYPGFKDHELPQRGAMSQVELLEIAEYMYEQYLRGYYPLTWNGLKFDFDILAEESGDASLCAELAWNHVDMMFQVLCVKGYPLSLKAASEGMDLRGKTEGMSGSLAPILWADDNERLLEMEREDLYALSAIEKRQHVVQYVGQDVVATLRLAEVCEKKKALYWTSKKGRPMILDLPKGWLPARRAMQLPYPSTAWMTDPMKRKDFTAWFDPIGHFVRKEE